MPDPPSPPSPSNMSSDDVEREIQKLKRREQSEELRRLRARAEQEMLVEDIRESVISNLESSRTLASARLVPPPTLEECSTYDMYKKKL